MNPEAQKAVNKYLKIREKIEFEELSDIESIQLIMINDMYRECKHRRVLIENFCVCLEKSIINIKYRKDFELICNLLDKIIYG